MHTNSIDSDVKTLKNELLCFGVESNYHKKLEEWSDEIGNLKLKLSVIVWEVFNSLSTLITTAWIFKILKSLGHLKRFNPNLNNNYFN
jgi:hypothetical protein